MRLNFCEAIETQNLKKIEREKRSRQPNWVAIFKRKLFFEKFVKEYKSESVGLERNNLAWFTLERIWTEKI